MRSPATVRLCGRIVSPAGKPTHRQSNPETDAPTGVEAAISVVSLTELHLGLLLATDDDERARRTDRLAAVEATFDQLPVTPRGGPRLGLATAVRQRGGQPRRRQIPLAIVVTASVERVPLLTHNIADFRIVEDLVDVRHSQA